jgi:uncharacterized membrane protein YdbT with pleckstrin-like domain
MNYINRVLQPGETITYRSQLHWIVYLPGWLIMAVGLAGLLLLPYREAGGFYHYASFSVMAVALVVLFIAWIKRVTTEIAVTNRRLIFKQGFISRRTMEMNMDKIESIDVNQSVIARVMGYGTIIVRGTGSGLEPLKVVDDPIALRNGVMRAASPSPPAAGRSA